MLRCTGSTGLEIDFYYIYVPTITEVVGVLSCYFEWETNNRFQSTHFYNLYFIFIIILFFFVLFCLAKLHDAKQRDELFQKRFAIKHEMKLHNFLYIYFTIFGYHFDENNKNFRFLCCSHQFQIIRILLFSLFIFFFRFIFTLLLLLLLLLLMHVCICIYCEYLSVRFYYISTYWLHWSEFLNHRNWIDRKTLKQNETKQRRDEKKIDNKNHEIKNLIFKK